MQEGGRNAWLLSTLLLAMTVLVGWVMSSAVWALATAVVMGLTVWRYFVPVYFEINHQGVFQEVLGRRSRIAWRSIGGVEVCRDGLLLTPGDVCCAAARGLYLPWCQHRVEVLALVSYHLHQIHPRESWLDFDVNTTD
jgi:hypothetical protein